MEPHACIFSCPGEDYIGHTILGLMAAASTEVTLSLHLRLNEVKKTLEDMFIKAWEADILVLKRGIERLTHIFDSIDKVVFVINGLKEIFYDGCLFLVSQF